MVTTSYRSVTLVDNLMPGERLDRLVATRILRWEMQTLAPGRMSTLGWSEWVDARGIVQSSGIDGGFHPSTDETAAHRLVKAWDGDFMLRKQNGMYIAVFYQPSEECQSTSGLSSIAICRAALKSSGIFSIPD